ncbi:4'-phosphopantetheinyl transferase sfp [Acaryochloris thomasi RCC1774]|uniref:4'-phosphopantetheinyl transferase sfp n=1 Tax=Acaryochloris thomasi RCC1774 TaxID=1764569 RepID=A0A2W1JN43_9CYAN|nr:4'-phosphopantetheinyl transferase superfamily protein [Acaryochloris thomasi]PZD74709.1 4'-phosphopantetheinyl transferase sfp [Acaryochloris thomasi RCC1774]
MVQRQEWQLTTGVPPLKAQEVQVWKLSLETSASKRAELWSTLSLDEQERAKRFIHVHDQQGFVVVRGQLRWLLAKHLEIEPAAVQFSYGDKGKPRLAADSRQALDLRFNLSHSHGIALIAVTVGQEIGVDLEQISTRIDFEGITQRFLTCGEQKALFNRPETERCAVFFQLWTRKEACIKALGGSIAQGLEQFDVSMGLDQTRNTVPTTEGGNLPKALILQDLKPTAGYVGALATSFVPDSLNQYVLNSPAYSGESAQS